MVGGFPGPFGTRAPPGHLLVRGSGPLPLPPQDDLRFPTNSEVRLLKGYLYLDPAKTVTHPFSIGLSSPLPEQGSGLVLGENIPAPCP